MDNLRALFEEEQRKNYKESCDGKQRETVRLQKAADRIRPSLEVFVREMQESSGFQITDSKGITCREGQGGAFFYDVHLDFSDQGRFIGSVPISWPVVWQEGSDGEEGYFPWELVLCGQVSANLSSSEHRAVLAREIVCELAKSNISQTPSVAPGKVLVLS